MEGDIAPLPAILQLAKKYTALVMLDDSHATGVIGKIGRGTQEHYGLLNAADIITGGTFGKALGGVGEGFIAAKQQIIDLCSQRFRPHLFSNSLPPVLAAAALTAPELLMAQPQLAASLQHKTAFFRKQSAEKRHRAT